MQAILLSEDASVFSIYPNPADEQVYISGKLYYAQQYQVVIYDVFGRTVQSVNYESAQGVVNPAIGTADLAEGTYFVELSANGTRYRQKLVISGR